MLQIMELADLRVAAVQQFDIQLCRDGVQLLGCDAQRDLVHAVAPGPEIVVLAVAPLGQAGERALEGMAVRIDKAGQRSAGEPCRAGRRGHARFNARPAAVGADLEQHRIGPTSADPGARRPQKLAHGRHAISVRTRRVSSGVTSAARASFHVGGGPSSM